MNCSSALNLSRQSRQTAEAIESHRAERLSSTQDNTFAHLRAIPVNHRLHQQEKAFPPGKAFSCW
jgi:hypothetical protein